jgi:hypothetical protein
MPDYGLMTKQERERLSNKGKGSILDRVAAGGAGAVLAATSLPLAMKSLSPAPLLYHGTDPRAAANILAGESPGILTRFAGKAGRLNEKMLANAAIYLAERKKLPISDDDIIDFMDDSLDKIRWGAAANEHKLFSSYDVTEVLEEGAGRLASKYGLKGDDHTKFMGDFGTNLKELGKRVYFGWHPSTVTQWGKKGSNEFHHVADKVMHMMEKEPAKLIGKTVFNTATMGAIPEAQQWWKLSKYRPETMGSKSRAELADLVSNLDPKIHSVVFGARVPGGETRWMKDFPGLAPALGVNPGLKHVISDFIPDNMFDPGRDLSVSTDVLPEHLRSVDVVDRMTKKVQRYKINSPKTFPKFRAGRMARGALNTLPTVALAALGIDLLQSAVRGDDTQLKKLLSAAGAHEPVMAKAAFLQELEKIASPAGGWAKKVLKYTVPLTLLGGASGLAAEEIVDKFQPAEAARDLEEPVRSAYLTARTAVVGNAAAGAGALLGLALGSRQVKTLKQAIKSGNFTPDDAKAFASVYARSTLGAGITTVAAMQADAVRRGTPAHALGPMNAPFAHPKLEEVARKNPQLAVLPTLATIAAVPAGGAYVLRKYYPGWAVRIARMAKGELDGGLLPAKTTMRESTRSWLEQSGVDPDELMSKERKKRRPGSHFDHALPKLSAFDELEKIALSGEVPWVFQALDKLADMQKEVGATDNLIPQHFQAKKKPSSSCPHCGAKHGALDKKCVGCGIPIHDPEDEQPPDDDDGDAAGELAKTSAELMKEARQMAYNPSHNFRKGKKTKGLEKYLKAARKGRR